MNGPTHEPILSERTVITNTPDLVQVAFALGEVTNELRELRISIDSIERTLAEYLEAIGGAK